MKYISLTCITLSITLTTFTMDTPSYIIPEHLKTHKKEIKELCSAALALIAHCKSSSDTKKATKQLVTIIEQTNCLKQAKITEREIGFLIFNQKEQLLAFTDRFLFSNGDNYIFASVFFDRLARYNKDIAEKGHISPNAAQALQHLKNNNLTQLAANSTQFGVIIPFATITEKRIPAPGSVAVTDFEELLRHISIMIKHDTKAMKKTAKLVYHAELKALYPFSSTNSTI